jgi:hypothetical protein
MRDCIWWLTLAVLVLPVLFSCSEGTVVKAIPTEPYRRVDIQVLEVSRSTSGNTKVVLRFINNDVEDSLSCAVDILARREELGTVYRLSDKVFNLGSGEVHMNPYQRSVLNLDAGIGVMGLYDNFVWVEGKCEVSGKASFPIKTQGLKPTR